MMSRGDRVVNKIIADALGDALHKAVDERDAEVVRAILKRAQNDFDINAKKDGVTPLIRAVETGCLETVRLFVEDPRTAINAVEIEQIQDVSLNRGTALMKAVSMGQMDTVSLLMSDRRLDPGVTHFGGCAAFDIALGATGAFRNWLR